MTDEHAAGVVEETAPDSTAPPAPPAAGAPTTPATPPVPAFPPVASAAADPARWGRVDDDGTVYVRTEDGERAVGSWQAGDAAEGPAHFAGRFDDLRTATDLLVRRLTAGRGDARAIRRSATALRERLADAAAVGDLVGLAARLDAVLAAADQADEADRAARA